MLYNNLTLSLIYQSSLNTESKSILSKYSKTTGNFSNNLPNRSTFKKSKSYKFEEILLSDDQERKKIQEIYIINIHKYAMLSMTFRK